MSRKEAILEAATQLFAQRGFSATPTADIAKKAGVAEGLVFHYFKTKEGILLHIFEEKTALYLSGSRIRAENCSTGLNAIKALINFHFEFSVEHSDALVILIRDFPSSLVQSKENLCPTRKTNFNRVISLLEKCINRGKLDGTIMNVPTRETAIIIQGMLNSISRLQMLGPIDIPDLTCHLMEFCIRAIGRTAIKKN